jgi:hypothetical protein
MTVRLEIGFEAAIPAAEQIARLRGELSELGSAIDATSGETDRATDAQRQLSEAASVVAVGVAAVTAAAVGAAVAIARVARASIDGERDFTRLDNALRGAGASFDSGDAQIREFFGTLQRTTRFSGGEAAQAMALITRRTQDFALSQEELAELTRTSADVAEQLGVTLEAASERVIKALEGESRAMRELGVEGETAEEIFAAIQERFDGAAQAANGLDLATARLTNAYDDLVRIAGRAITEHEGLQATVRAAAVVVEVLADILDTANEEYAEMRAQLAQIIPAFGASGASADQFAVAVGGVVRGLAVAINTLRAAEIAAIGLRIGVHALATGVVALGTAVLEGMVLPIGVATEALRDLAQRTAEVLGFIPGMGAVARAAQGVADGFGDAADGVESVRAALQGTRDEALRTFGEASREGVARIGEIANAMAETDEAARRFAESFREAVAAAGPGATDVDVMARVRVALDARGDDEARAAGERIAEQVDRGREEKERALARDRERRAREMSAQIARAEVEASRIVLSLMDDQERRAHTLARARVAFGVEGYADEIDLAAESERILSEIRKASSDEQRAALSEDLALIREYHAERQALARESAAEEARLQAEAEANARRMAQGITQAARTSGAAIGRIFAGADPGEEFARLALQQVGSLIAGIGEAAIIEGALQLIPGPSFNPAAGGARIALGAAAVALGSGMGAAASASAPQSAAGAAPPPQPAQAQPMPGGGGGGGETFIQYNDFGPHADPYAAAREQRRAGEAGQRAGVGRGRAA